MDSYESLNAIHQAFVDWAVSTQAVEIDGVEAAQIPGRGHGIVASRDVAKGERLVFVPANSLITIDSGFVKQLKLPSKCTVHGRLAAALMILRLDESRYYSLWERTWPTREDFAEVMPIQWERELVDLLPQPARVLREKQSAKLTKDREDLQHAVSGEDLNGDLYTYYWLAVNTRCFFWDYPTASASRKRVKRKKTLNTDDCMALCPFADYFNHAEEGCEFDYDASGCWLTADRDYRAGEEIFVSYGKHTNDFLLVEYGFTLSPNRWDNIKLDEYILPKLKASQKNLLEAHGLMGNYALDSSDICYRTQAAIRGLVLSKAKLRQFLAGENDGEEEQGTVDRKCVEILVEFQKGARKRQITIDKLSKSPHKECLTERWKQLDNMISSGIQRWC